jgi:hypothetical protein
MSAALEVTHLTVTFGETRILVGPRAMITLSSCDQSTVIRAL